MSTAPASFDLISEPWIPCIDAGEQPIELGLAEVFCRAHELSRIADPSPLATFAIYRLLLAVTHRVVRGPRTLSDWRTLWDRGRFDGSVFENYFAEWRGRFDLFSATRPFLQVADFSILGGKGEATSAVTRLLPELASGNNATLFDHRLDEDLTAVRPADAARALLVAQAWGLGGGKGPTSNLFGAHPYMSHAPCVGAVATWIASGDLFHSLLLNLGRIGPDQPPPFVSDETDCPTWERDAPRRPGAHVPTGYLEFLTWPARIVRLVPPSPGSSGVTEMHFAPGPTIADAGFSNPFAFYRESEKFGRSAIPLGVERAIWRDSSAIFGMPDTGGYDLRPQALRLCQERRLRSLLGERAHLGIVCFGLANDKAKPLCWRREEIPTPIRLLEDRELVTELDAGLRAVERVWVALRAALRKLAYVTLETPTKTPDPEEVRRIAMRLERRCAYWGRVEGGFHRFLHNLGGEARRTWVSDAIEAARADLRRMAQHAEGSIARAARALALSARELSFQIGSDPEITAAMAIAPTPDPNQPAAQPTEVHS